MEEWAGMAGLHSHHDRWGPPGVAAVGGIAPCMLTQYMLLPFGVS